MKRVKFARMVILLLFIFGFPLGCSVGPNALKQGHLRYNTSVKASADEELLLNIVRLRYLDTIEFLATNSISAQTSIKVSLGAELGDDGGDRQFLVKPEFEFSDRPTFTFTPQRGREFARKLIEPIDINTFSYLAASDWPIHLLLLLLGSEINGVTNDIGSDIAKYNDIAARLKELKKKGDLLFGFLENEEAISDPIDANSISAKDLIAAAKSGYRFRNSQQNGKVRLTKKVAQPVVWIRFKYGNYVEIKQLLNLREDKSPPYYIKTGSGLYRQEKSYQSIVLRTRSLLSSIAYLSQAVHPPNEHLTQGIAPDKWPLRGIGDADIAKIFQVQSSRVKPAASLSVKYRGYWFYIDETDMTSKAAFLVMAEIYRLAISEGRPGQVPILTLPVGG